MAQSYNKTSNFVSEVLSRGIAKPNRYEVSIDTPVCISNPNLTRLVNLFCDQVRNQIPILINHYFLGRQYLEE